MATAAATATAGLLIAPPAGAAGTTIYVDGANPACSDAGPGSAAQPLCTLVQGGKKVLAGQTLQVAAGTYSGEVAVTHSGTAADPIVVQPAPGATVVVTGGNRGFYLSKRSYVTVTGFTVTGTTGAGLYLTLSDHITLSGNDVSAAGQPASGLTARGVYVSGSTAVVIQGNTIHHNSDSGVYLTGGSTGVEVRGNEIWGNARGYQRAAAGVDVRAPDNLVIANFIHDNEDSGVSNYPGGDRTRVLNNVIWNNKGTSPILGVVGDHGIDNLGVTGSVIVGNTVVNNTTAGINLEGGSTGGLVKNNISVDNGIASPRTTSNIRVDASSTAGTIVDHNLVNLSSGTYNYIFGTGWYTSSALMAAATGQEVHGLTAVPGFVSPASGDFHLLPTSPAVDSADSGAPSALATDVLGAPRVDVAAVLDTGSGPRSYDDRGAYEYPGP